MSNAGNLVIVIPAYKAKFLDSALSSIASQSIKDFQVLVADDCSPHNLKEICQKYSPVLNLIYHRFESNLGAKSLADQWTRCVRLTTASWIWLFSDDDIADANCVEAFFRTMQDPSVCGSQLFHFDTRIIDEYGKLIRNNIDFPTRLSSKAFVQARMRARISSFACEYIFSRQAFNDIGKFVSFPAAWCSDDASWISLAGDSDIVTIKGAKVNWRRSGINISSPESSFGSAKVYAMLMFMEWLNDKEIDVESGCASAWFMTIVKEQRLIVSPKNWIRGAKALQNVDHSSKMQNVAAIAWHDLEITIHSLLKRLRRYYRWH